MKIAVAGTGYVGLSIATLLAQHNEVVAVDVIPEKVEKINQRISPIQDDYIEKYLAEKELNLTATLDGASAYRDAEFIVIAAPTNYDPQLNFFDTHHIEDVIDLFTKERVPKGLTKQKFEILSQQSTEIDEIVKSVGNKFTILTGRAGTGKTMQLLQLAFKLASNENSNRCIILTYNNALVSDIKRLIDYTPMPTKVNGRTVSIQTIHSFFHYIFEDFGRMPVPKHYDMKCDIYESNGNYNIEMDIPGYEKKDISKNLGCLHACRRCGGRTCPYFRHCNHYAFGAQSALLGYGRSRLERTR